MEALEGSGEDCGRGGPRSDEDWGDAGEVRLDEGVGLDVARGSNLLQLWKVESQTQSLDEKPGLRT